MGSSVQSHDGADACAHGLQIGAFNIDIVQQLSDPVSQKDFPPYTFPTSLPLLGLPNDVIGVGPDVGAFSPTPLHTPGHHAQDVKGGISSPTPPPSTCTALSCG